MLEKQSCSSAQWQCIGLDQQSCCVSGLLSSDILVTNSKTNTRMIGIS